MTWKNESQRHALSARGISSVDVVRIKNELNGLPQPTRKIAMNYLNKHVAHGVKSNLLLKFFDKHLSDILFDPAKDVVPEEREYWEKLGYDFNTAILVYEEKDEGVVLVIMDKDHKKVLIDYGLETTTHEFAQSIYDMMVDKGKFKPNVRCTYGGEIVKEKIIL